MTLSVKKENQFLFTNDVFLLFSAILLDLVSNVVTKQEVHGSHRSPEALNSRAIPVSRGWI